MESECRNEFKVSIKNDKIEVSISWKEDEDQIFEDSSFTEYEEGLEFLCLGVAQFKRWLEMKMDKRDLERSGLPF